VTKCSVAVSLLMLFVCRLAVAGEEPRIAEVISPDVLVVKQGSTADIRKVAGKPVYYCGLNTFKRWAAPLVGQRVYSDDNGDLDIMLDDRPVSLKSLLVNNGWLQPTELDDPAQAAIAERRGGWNCASTEMPFALMHRTVDPKVLASIALNESAYDGRPWPWTLNVAGQGYYFRSREGAYSAIEKLLADGRCDFDVGIMQINWCYHGQRFVSAWDALSPQTNIAVAEDILNENYRKTGSASKAIAYYHSADPNPGAAYFERFIVHLEQVNNGL
jgi:Transglycosylase SLT domain